MTWGQPVAWATAAGLLALAVACTGATRAIPLAGPVTLLLVAACDGIVVLLLSWLAAALGARLLTWLRVLDPSPGERLLIGLGLGLGALAVGLLALGLLGLLQPVAIVSLIVGLAALAARAVPAVPADVRAAASVAWRHRPARPLLVLLGAVLGLTLMLTLVPPVTWDGLAYHLAAPRAWLALGRLTPLADNPPANYPSYAQLLYALLLALGSESGPQMLHAALAVATVALTGLAASRLGGPRAGWLAAVALASAPAVTYYAWHANIDFVWTFAEAVGLYGLLRALTSDQTSQSAAGRPWLAVAGLGLGLAAGMKYLSLGSLALAAATVIIIGLARRRHWAALAGDLAWLVAPAVLIGGPWYLRNALALGNPVWPTFGGGGGWSDVRAASFARYVANIGHPAGWPDLLWLPLRLFTGDHEQPLAIPSILMLLAPLALLAPRRPERVTLLAYLAAQFLLWSRGMTEVRFLFPAFVVASVLVGLVLADPPRRLQGRRTARVLAALPVLALALGLAPLLVFAAHVQPWRPLLGLETRPAFVSRLVATYSAAVYLNQHAPAGSRVLLIGDGRLYYHDHPARSDVFRDALPELAAAGDTPLAWQAWLTAGGFTHVLVSPRDLEFVTAYLPADEYARQLALLRRLEETLLTPVFRDRGVTVYEIKRLT
ncbi:MAG: hypothetical protein IT340_15280 [Chloroflexi bacterium]|nr:hypothetical protein [Chloroflexota bacterium]